MAEGKTKEPSGDPEEAARLRAALAYADMELEEAAEVLGVAKRTVSRYLSAETKPSEDPWPKILEATGLPHWWASPNFEPEPEAPKLLERVEALEHQMATLLRRAGGEPAPAPTPSEVADVTEAAIPRPGDTQPRRAPKRRTRQS